MSRKKSDLSKIEMKKELIELINDAQELNFNPQLIRRYKKQLTEVENQINKQRRKKSE